MLGTSHAHSTFGAGNESHRWLPKVNTYGPPTAMNRQTKRYTTRKLPAIDHQKTVNVTSKTEVKDGNARQGHNVQLKTTSRNTEANKKQMETNSLFSNFRTQQNELQLKYNELTKTYNDNMRRHQSEVLDLYEFMKNIRKVLKDEPRDSDIKYHYGSDDDRGENTAMLSRKRELCEDKLVRPEDAIGESKGVANKNRMVLPPLTKPNAEGPVAASQNKQTRQHHLLPGLGPRPTILIGTHAEHHRHKKGATKGKRFLEDTVSHGGVCKRCILRGRIVFNISHNDLSLPPIVVRKH